MLTLAHDPGGGSGHWLAAWHADPLIVGTLLAVSLLYGYGLHRLWRNAAPGRGVPRRQAWSFAAGILVLVIALLSPVDALADELNWMHMVQHMLIMMVAAPLCVLGAPAAVSIWAFPSRTRRRMGEGIRRLDAMNVRRYFLWQPLLLWALFAITLWIWHLPGLYEAALRHQRLHDLQHLMFFIASVLFWRILLDPLSRLRLNPGAAVFYLFTTSLHATFLGVFMALAPRAWYPHYEHTTAPWGLSALEDQQLAGFIMWMPACMIFALAAAVVLGYWLYHGPVRTPEIAARAPSRPAPLGAHAAAHSQQPHEERFSADD